MQQASSKPAQRPNIKVLKRPNEGQGSPSEGSKSESQQSFKSLEEKEREYNEARDKIFSEQENKHVPTPQAPPVQTPRATFAEVSGNGLQSESPSVKPSEDVKSDSESKSTNQRVHYSEKVTEVDLPSHILQIDGDAKSVDMKTLKSFAASKLNAELRFDSDQIIILFQSGSAAAQAQSDEPFIANFKVKLASWKPKFFPTSMF